MMTLIDRLSDSIDLDSGRPDALILRVAGEVDIATTVYVRSQWTKMLSVRQPSQDIAIIDLSQVTFFGCTGLAALIQFQDNARQNGLALRLVVRAGDRTILRPLALTGLLGRFEIHPNLDTALTS